MAKTGRPKSENVKKKVLSIRVEDPIKRICELCQETQNDCDRSSGSYFVFFYNGSPQYMWGFLYPTY